MTCGLGLGIFLICLVQTEHVYSWTKDVLSFQRSNTHVGFPQLDGRVRAFGSYPQNQVRQGFSSPQLVQSSSSSFNAKPAASSVYGHGLSARSHKQALSQPARSSVRLLQISSQSKPNRQSVFAPRTAPKQSFSLSTAVASGAAVSPRSETQKDLTDLSRKGFRPSKQGTQSSSTSLSSISSYAWGPSGNRYSNSASSLFAAQMPSTFEQPASSAILFGPVGPGPRSPSVRMQTFARAPAKRVSLTRRSGEPAQASSWHVSREGSYRPRSQLQVYNPSRASQLVYNLAVPRSSTVGASAPGFAPATVYDIPNRYGGSPIRRLRDPDVQNQQQLAKPLPLWLASANPHFQGSHPESKWNRIQMRTL